MTDTPTGILKGWLKLLFGYLLSHVLLHSGRIGTQDVDGEVVLSDSISSHSLTLNVGPSVRDMHTVYAMHKKKATLETYLLLFLSFMCGFPFI